MSKIEENLYLGDLRSLQQCNNLNIDIVVTILNFKPKINDVYPSITHIYFNAEDDDDFNISVYFDEFIKIMEENKNKNILVHCYAGASRSASLVASWMIHNSIKKATSLKKLDKVTVAHTLMIMKKKRQCVDPNDGFVRQLENFRIKCITNVKVEKQNQTINT